MPGKTWRATALAVSMASCCDPTPPAREEEGQQGEVAEAAAAEAEDGAPCHTGCLIPAVANVY